MKSPIQQGYQLRPIDIPPVADWTPDFDFHDTAKINGHDLPMTVKISRFRDIKDIELQEWICYKSLFRSSCVKVFTIPGFVDLLMDVNSMSFRSRDHCLHCRMAPTAQV